MFSKQAKLVACPSEDYSWDIRQTQHQGLCGHIPCISVKVPLTTPPRIQLQSVPMLYMLILQQALRIPQTQFNDSLYSFLLTDPYKRGPEATQVK